MPTPSKANKAIDFASLLAPIIPDISRASANGSSAGLKPKPVFRSKYSSELQNVLETFSRWLYLPDLSPVIAVLGAVAAHPFPSNPVWLVLTGPSSCQPKGSKVLMADGGWKEVQDVRVGDMVMSPQQDQSMVAARIEEVFVYPDTPLYEVGIESHAKIIKRYRCSGSHILPFMCPKQGLGSHKTRKSVKDFREMMVSDFLRDSAYLHRVSTAFTSPAFDLPPIEVDVHPYVLGVMLGDGNWTTGNMRLTKDQPRLFAKMESLGVVFGKDCSYGRALTKWIRNPYRLRLQELECHGTLSKEKFVPEIYKRGSLQQRLDLLAGLIDTDGEAREFSTASERLADDFVYLVHSVGGFANKRARTTKCNGKVFRSFRVGFMFEEHKPEILFEHKIHPPRNRKLNTRNRKMVVKSLEVSEPVYGFRVASPSQWFVTDDWIVTHNSGKSELLNSLSRLDHIHPVSTITPGALLSGTSAKEVTNEGTGGILKQFSGPPDGHSGILLFKDFTTLFSMPHEGLTSAISALREISDGCWDRPVGTDGARVLHWHGKAGMLAACTQVAIEKHQKVIAACGERMIYCRLAPSDRYEQALRAWNNSSVLNRMKEELSMSVYDLFSSIPSSQYTPILDKSAIDQLLSIAVFTSAARSAVDRDAYDHQISLKSDSDGPSRMTQSLSPLLAGMLSIGCPLDEAWKILCKVALDSIPTTRRLVLSYLAPRFGTGVATGQIAHAVGYSGTVIRRVLEDLEVHGIVNAERDRADYWQFTDASWTAYVTGFPHLI